MAIDEFLPKADWGAGPWQDEPDHVDWEHAGLPCLAHRNHHGVWCGYVAVPPGHPLHGATFEQVDVDVHGGLTYADVCQGAICHVPKPGEPEEVWWFGFDCAHAWDVMPALEARLRLRGLESLHMPPAEYRTLAYVTAETNRLAAQLALAAEAAAGPVATEAP